MPWSSSSSTQPVLSSARRPSVEPTTPTSMAPSSSESGMTPKSSGVKLAVKSTPYTRCRPGMQNPLDSQSGGAPSVRSAPFSARSDSVVMPRLSEVSCVITNALVSTASDGAPATMPMGSRRGSSTASVSSTSLVACARPVVEELELGRHVVERHVHVARLECPEEQVAEPADLGGAGVVPGVGERAGVDLGEDQRLAEVLGPDRDGGAVGHCRRRRCRRRWRRRHRRRRRTPPPAG